MASGCAEGRWQSNWCSCSRVRTRASTSICLLPIHHICVWVWHLWLVSWEARKGVRFLTPGAVESCMHHAVAKDLTCILCKSSWWFLSHQLLPHFSLKNAKGYSNVTFSEFFAEYLWGLKESVCKPLIKFHRLISSSSLIKGSESSCLFSKHVFPEWNS